MISMSNSIFVPYQKNNVSIRREPNPLTMQNYQLNKLHTTSIGINQFIRDANRLNYQDEDDNSTRGNSENNNISLMNNNTYNTPTKSKNKSHSHKKPNQFPSLSIDSESITNIKQVTVKDESAEKNGEKKEKKQLFNVIKENEILDENVRADDYREKIARHILNEYCYNKVNTIIKGKIRKKFKKIPKDIPNKASRKRNKHFLAMTLKEFYESIELYKENKKKKTFNHNLNIINELRKDCHKNFREESGLNDLLEITFSDLVVQYLKSIEYDEYINTLKGNEKQYYIHFAEHFIEHYDN